MYHYKKYIVVQGHIIRETVLGQENIIKEKFGRSFEADVGGHQAKGKEEDQVKKKWLSTKNNLCWEQVCTFEEQKKGQ